MWMDTVSEQSKVDVPNTKAMLARLEASRSIAAESLTELELQREKMMQIDRLNEEQTEELTKAGWLAKKLSVRGRVSTFFQKKPSSKGSKKTKDKQPQTPKKDDQKSKKEELSEEDKIWKDKDKGPTHPDYSVPELTQEQQQMIKEQDGDLDQMSNILQDMKEISKKMNSTLNSQSKVIDHIGEQVERNSELTIKTTMKITR